MARYYDAEYGRFLAVDPLAGSPQNIRWSSYAYVWDNPINVIDTDGRSGEAVINKENKTITITSNIIFYGSDGTAELAKTAAEDIQSQWNLANGKVTIDGIEYSMNFVVTGIFNNTITENEIKNNVDIKNNYIKLVKEGIAVSKMDGEGSNTGIWLIKNINSPGSTTAAHEFGHGFGLPHPHNTNLLGKGKPTIMFPRGTLVDAEFTYDPEKGDSYIDPQTKEGVNTMNPKNRFVSKQDIDDLRIDKINFDPITGTGNLGGLTNIRH